MAELRQLTSSQDRLDGFYTWARYYDPAAGRFISEDPIGFDAGMNFYSYVSNSPLINFDPTGLAQCIFTMDGKNQTGYMVCHSNDPRKPPLSFPAASGNNGEETKCKNNPDCAANDKQGPIPLGQWSWTDRPNSKRKVGGRSLEPVPGTGTNAAEGRTGILSHWCANAFGPSKGPKFCSEGCVTANESDIRALNALIDSEPGSILIVVRATGGQ